MCLMHPLLVSKSWGDSASSSPSYRNLAEILGQGALDSPLGTDPLGRAQKAWPQIHLLGGRGCSLGGENRCARRPLHTQRRCKWICKRGLAAGPGLQMDLQRGLAVGPGLQMDLLRGLACGSGCKSICKKVCIFTEKLCFLFVHILGHRPKSMQIDLQRGPAAGLLLQMNLQRGSATSLSLQMDPQQGSPTGTSLQICMHTQFCSRLAGRTWQQCPATHRRVNTEVGHGGLGGAWGGWGSLGRRGGLGEPGGAWGSWGYLGVAAFIQMQTEFEDLGILDLFLGLVQVEAALIRLMRGSSFLFWWRQRVNRFEIHVTEQKHMCFCRTSCRIKNKPFCIKQMRSNNSVRNLFQTFFKPFREQCLTSCGIKSG